MGEKKIISIKMNQMFATVFLLCFFVSMPLALDAGSKGIKDTKVSKSKHSLILKEDFEKTVRNNPKTLLVGESEKNNNYNDNFKKVDSLFNKYNSNSPGCTLGIVYKGELIYAKGYGMADVEKQIPNSPDKLFDIASTSKQFTAFSILLLEEQEKLSIEDKIRKYIPELPESYEPVLIQHLLTHTSGIRDHYALMALTGIEEISSEKQNWTNHNYNEKAVFNILVKQNELNFAPGTDQQYCNSGFYLAGKIIERISGISLREFYQKFLFTPLNMKNTFLYDDNTFYHKNRTMGYSNKKNGYRRNLIKYETYGDGQIITCINDMYLWDKNFYINKLGKRKHGLITKEITKGQLKNGVSVDYSIGGLEVSSYKGLTVIDRMGGTQGISSDIVRFPDQEFTVICLSNYQDLNPDPWRASLKIADIFLKEHFKENKNKKTIIAKMDINLTKEFLQSLTGFYYNDKNKKSRSIYFKDGKLKFNNMNLIALDSNNFKVDGWFAKIRFVKNADNINELHWQSFTNPFQIYSKKNKTKYNKTSIKKFTGNYHSTELNINCQVITKNDKLIMLDSDKKKSVFTPLFKDTFSAKYNAQDVTIEFRRDTDDKIIELRMSTDWLMNMRFKKIKTKQY